MSGPVFLLIYLLLVIAVNLWLRRDQRQNELARSMRFMEIAKDPYQLACLRAGCDEAVRLCVFSLIDRGLLEEESGAVQRTRADGEAIARRPLEKAILLSCRQWTKIDSIQRARGVVAAAKACQTALEKQELLAGTQTRSARLLPFLGAFGLLIGVAIGRILWAFAHGRHNVGFLIILAIFGGIALIIAWRRRRTALGDSALDRLSSLFANLKNRADNLVPGGQDQDAVLTAALFGFSLLPAEQFPYLDRVFPTPKTSGDSSSGGDSGSSDSGGGCGGGCGGGGCGGCGG